MRAVVQRVSEASVTVNGAIVGAVERGLLVLVGVDTEDVEKIGFICESCQKTQESYTVPLRTACE